MKPWMIWLLALVAIAVTIWAARAEESAPLPQITVEQQQGCRQSVRIAG